MKKINNVTKKIKDSLEKTQTIQLVNRITKSRVLQNKHLYTEDNNPDVKPIIENLNLTKQQRFNFESNKFEDDLAEKKNKKEKSKNSKIDVKKELLNVEKEKNKYKKRFILFLILFFLLLVLLSIVSYCYICYKPKEVIKEVEKKIVDENIVFLGDSITHRYDLDKYFSDYNTVNSGVEGNRASDILDDMKDRVYRYNPSKIFLLIGTNDLDDAYELSVEDVYNNVVDITSKITQKRKLSKIYIESVYPVNGEVTNTPARGKDNTRIQEYNEKLKKLCKEKGYTYIDLYSDLLDEDDHLSIQYTTDGLHISDEGYDLITEKIKKYISE